MKYLELDTSRPERGWQETTRERIEAAIFDYYVVTEPAVLAIHDGYTVTTPYFHFRAEEGSNRMSGPQCPQCGERFGAEDVGSACIVCGRGIIERI